MAYLPGVEILHLVGPRHVRRCVCRLARRELIIVDEHALADGVVRATLRHLHRDVAGVRRQERVRLLALLDFFLLKTQNHSENSGTS